MLHLVVAMGKLYQIYFCLQAYVGVQYVIRYQNDSIQHASDG